MNGPADLQNWERFENSPKISLLYPSAVAGLTIAAAVAGRCVVREDKAIPIFALFVLTNLTGDLAYHVMIRNDPMHIPGGSKRGIPDTNSRAWQHLTNSTTSFSLISSIIAGVGLCCETRSLIPRFSAKQLAPWCISATMLTFAVQRFTYLRGEETPLRESGAALSPRVSDSVAYGQLVKLSCSILFLTAGLLLNRVKSK